MSRWFTARMYLRHLWQAKKWSSFHSPYLFQLISYCSLPQSSDPDFEKIERVRNQWKMSDEAFERKDFGAGSKTIKAATRQKISAIAKNALSLPVQCRFMARLATFSRARQILELGTSLGITAAYLQAGAPEAAIMTVEGDEMLADKARQTLAMLGAHNVTVFQQTFDDFLENHAFSAPPDLVFIDGNHRSEAVQAYLRKLLPSLSSKAIIIVDDIYWSQDMYEGWKSILQWPEIRQSIDCFRFGLLFVNPDFLDTAHHRIILPNW